MQAFHCASNPKRGVNHLETINRDTVCAKYGSSFESPSRFQGTVLENSLTSIWLCSRGTSKAHWPSSHISQISPLAHLLCPHALWCDWSVRSSIIEVRTLKSFDVWWFGLSTQIGWTHRVEWFFEATDLLDLWEYLRTGFTGVTTNFDHLRLLISGSTEMLAVSCFSMH